MRKLSLLIVITLLLSGCSTGDKTPTLALGDIPSCDQIDTSRVTTKKLQMQCLDGSSNINFYSIKGPLIINVWASWCEGCKEEMPYFIDLYANPVFKNGQIKLLGIDVDEKNADSGPNFIKSYGMSWPHLIDIEDKSKFLFGPGVPVTWFIDETGGVVESKIGAYSSKEELFKQVEKAFKVKL